jgi:hypothetical protein
MGARGHLALGAVEDIAALNAYHLDVDDDASGLAHGVGQLLIAKHIGGAGLMIDSCLHTKFLC